MDSSRLEDWSGLFSVGNYNLDSMVKVSKSATLNEYINIMYSVYCGRRRGFDVCHWINTTNGKSYGQREIARIGKNYVDLCLN